LSLLSSLSSLSLLAVKGLEEVVEEEGEEANPPYSSLAGVVRAILVVVAVRTAVARALDYSKVLY
jgi:hypothetical protein